MALSEYLERGLITCRPDTEISKVAELMKDEDVGAVLIVENDRPAGIVTDRDLVLRCIVEEMDCSTPVSEVMTKAVDTVSIDEGIYQVIERMKKSEVRRIPVVDQSGKAVGLLSFGDIFALLAKEFSDLTNAASPDRPKIDRAA